MRRFARETRGRLLPRGWSRSPCSRRGRDLAERSHSPGHARKQGRLLGPTSIPAPSASIRRWPESGRPSADSHVLDPRDVTRTAQTVALFGLISLAPVAVMMVTAFVRINIVLVLLRQALGSPSGPGEPGLMALALLLTALVMRPVGERVYDQAIVPYTSGQATPAEAWQAGSAPIKAFMVDQIMRTRHEDYLWTLYDYAAPPSPGRPSRSTATTSPSGSWPRPIC